MEVPVQLQIAVPAVVDGLGTLAKKVCDNMHVSKSNHWILRQTHQLPYII